MTSFVNWFAATLGKVVAPQIAVAIVSILPLIELRGGIVLGFMLKLPLWQSIVFSLIGNIIPIPFILLFVNKIFDWLRPTKHLGKLVTKLENRALKKSDGIKKAEFIGLVLFVGIPLPGTGGWTGALIASLLKVDLKKASLAILIGIALACTIMSLITYGVIGNIV